MILFFSSYTLLLLYFLIKKRNFDLNFVGFLGFIAYFFPLFFIKFNEDISVHILASLILFLFLFYTILYDLLIPQSSMNSKPKMNNPTFFTVLYVLTAFLLFLIIIQTGTNGLLSNKTDRTYNLHVYNLFVATVSMGFVYSFYFKFKKQFVFYLILIFLLFLSGTRTHLVMAAFTLFVLSNSTENKKFLFNSILSAKFLFLVGGISFLGIFGKDIYASTILSLSTDRNFIEIFTHRIEGSSFIQIISKTEPFHTSSIFQKIVIDDFIINKDYIFELPYHFLPISSPFTDSLHVFSKAVKDHYFSGWSDNSGVGGNFWAEGYSLFGFSGVILFVLIYLKVLFLFDLGFRKFPNFYKPIFVLSGVFWAFYIQRNSLFQIISHDKRLIYTFMLILFLSLFVKIFKLKYRKSN